MELLPSANHIPFIAIGMTPPHGRQGHSLPTPRALGQGPIYVAPLRLEEGDIQTLQDQRKGSQTTQKRNKNSKNVHIDVNTSKGSSPWYIHREPILTPLDQIRPVFDVKILESFREDWDGEREEEIVRLTQRLTFSPDFTDDREEVKEFNRFNGDSLLSFSYKPSSASVIPADLSGSFVSAFSHPLNASLNLPFVTSPAKDKDAFLFPTTARNPNKALFTIDAKSSLILVANDVACNLFGYQRGDLIGLKIQYLFTEPYQARQRALVEENIDVMGETVLVSGKVMDAVTSYGLEFPVSVWMKKVKSPHEPRVIVVIEPVERCSAHFTLNEEGIITCCDPWFAILFGYETERDVINNHLSHLVPSVAVPDPPFSNQTTPKQSLTGRTKDGNVFPLTVRFTGQSCEPIEILSEREVHQTERGIEHVVEKEQQQDEEKDCLENEKVYSDIEQKLIDNLISHDDHVSDSLLQELHTSHNTCISHDNHVIDPVLQESHVSNKTRISHDDHVTDSVLKESHVFSNSHISHDDHVIDPVLQESHVSNKTCISHDNHVTNPVLLESNNTRISHDNHVTDTVLKESHVSTNTPISHDDHVIDSVLKSCILHDNHVTDPFLQTSRNTCISQDDPVTDPMSQESPISSIIRISHDDHVTDPVLDLDCSLSSKGSGNASNENGNVSNQSGLELSDDCLTTTTSEMHYLIKGECPIPDPDITSPSLQTAPIISTQPIISTSHRVFIHGKVIVYAALSGMVTFSADGCIQGCNHHLVLMLFGYTQKELLKKEITFLLPDFYSHLKQYDEEQEDEGNTMIHPIFELEINKMDDHKEEAGDRQRDSLVDEMFPTVSERSISVDHTLDSQLTSIIEAPEENEDDVFLSEEMTNSGSITGSSGLKCDGSLLGENWEGDGETWEEDGEHQEVVIQFLPHVVTIGDKSYEYCSDSDESVKERSLNEIQEITQHTEIDESPAKNYQKLNEQMIVESLETSSQFSNRNLIMSSSPLPPHNMSKPSNDVIGGAPHTSSTPSKPSSRPTSRMSSTTSRSSIFPEGTFVGRARHKDGSLMTVVFQLKHIVLRNDQSLCCMWITREIDCLRAREADHSMSRITPDPFTRSLQPTPDGSSQGISDPQEETLATEGEYSDSYDTLGPIGRGAFGFVKLARKRDDELLVVVKFIKKATVIPEHWIEHEVMGVVPREICLLAELSHPNIVKLLEAYENEQYFQLVMEKHGDGMDLFTFIESGPHLDEPLISYMFRQIVSALSYLHERHILHRDVKDENIILDHNFHMKIIDFGSAAKMKDGKLFNTFCGTLEYCSPEVLLGNSYAGPELEMWSLGVTLYTLVYGENPFFDVEEIIAGRLQPPFLVSPGLMKVLLWLLHPDPVSRATLSDLDKDRWVNQDVNITQYSFENVMLGGIDQESNAQVDSSLPTSVVLQLNRTLS